ncbi:hypothetical protein M8J75_003661 [Diaphorina citri]|nr:hypothetical protein M8J75_003661 [Diaphorina citri]
MEIKAKNDGPILDVQFEQHELPNVTSSMLLRSATEKEVYNIMKNMKKTGQGSDGIRNGDVVRNAATLTPLWIFLLLYLLSKDLQDLCYNEKA